MATEGDGDYPIAAFAVAKGGVVLKHIFLNAPPPEMIAARGGRGVEEEEDPPVMVGRHPDCHVLVDHPSVSRFHLEVRSRRRQRRITVTDLASVHGTWVSGRRIPAHTPVELVAGDTLRLGASRREYRLLWLTLREAFEMEDPLPPLLEEDKEESRPYQEASNQVVTGQRVSVDIEIHQEASQQIVSQHFAIPDKVTPSAPPLPEFAQSIYLEDSALSQFHENRERITEKRPAHSNPISESCGSLITQEMTTGLANAGRTVQSDKRDATRQVSHRAKLKSVKSLRVDTGRSTDTSSALNYSFQKPNDILVCSQNCGTECSACIALFGIPEFGIADEKEVMIAEDKVHMNPPASITMEENKEPNPENSNSQDLVDATSQKSLGLLHSDPSVDSKDDTFTDKENQQQIATTVTLESSEPVLESPFMEEVKHDALVSAINLEGNFSNNENTAPDKIAEDHENCQLEGTICRNLLDSLDTEGVEENDEISQLDMENITPCMSGNIQIVRSHTGLKATISQELMDSISPLNLEHYSFSENEKSMVNTGNQMKSNEPMLTSADTELQKSQTECMPISHLDFKDDILPDNENSVLDPAREGDLFSDKENVTPISKDPKAIGRRIFGSRMDASASADNTSDKGIHKLECNEFSATSPAREEDLFSDKENVTPISKDPKPTGRRILGSRMDSSVSADNTSNKGLHKLECNEFSAKSKRLHIVDYDVFYSDKENLTPVSSRDTKARKCLAKNLTVDADQDQEAFSSDKENLTPLSSAAPKTRALSENRARFESAITKKRIVDRLPFQTLVSNSPLRPTSSLDCNCAVPRAADFTNGGLAVRLEDEMNNLPCTNQESGRDGQGMKIWTMVADTDCLLDDESRKSIMLLKGIKGTRLIIPMIVIRELDSMKQREGLFRRSTKATSVLQWIDECMETESWWIHVQSSSDMFPVAPTPPATPSMCFDKAVETGPGSFNPMSLFSPRGFADIISPRPDDRVLDCALHFNRIRSNETIVIVSHSITLKIKAMAEGLLCEGAKEFRESLMNPCSSRFMWAASVPRGSAWSCLDEAALTENYYNSHHRETARRRVPRQVEDARGLKLILLHNSLYAQATNAARMTPLASMASV